MTDDPLIDDRLRLLLAESDTGPDEAFVARVARLVQAEQRIEAGRAEAWRRFRREAAASAAVAAAFVLVGRLAPATGAIDLLSFAPATAAALLILFWMIVGMRPAGAID